MIDLESRLSILMESFANYRQGLVKLLQLTARLSANGEAENASEANSLYTNQIIKHVMALDRNNQLAKIRLMLAQEYVNIFKSTGKRIAFSSRTG